MEAAKPRRFAYDVAVHCLEQIFAGGIGREIQFGIQSVELEYVVMDRPGAGARPKVGRRFPATDRNAGTVSRAIRQIALTQSLGQACSRSRDIERRPVEGVGRSLVRGILNIVKNHGVGLETIGRGARICAYIPVELEGRRLVLACAGSVFQRNFRAVRKCGCGYRKHAARWSYLLSGGRLRKQHHGG